MTTSKAVEALDKDAPLSPYLFVLAINELSISMQEALSSAHLTGISLGPNCPPIHSLVYADDLLVCGIKLI